CGKPRSRNPRPRGWDKPRQFLGIPRWLGVRLVWKWLLISVVGGIAISSFLTLGDLTPDLPEWVPDSVMEVVFWPVNFCVWLSGPGVNIGTPEKTFYEGTPLQFTAADAGMCLTWLFYSTLVCILYWFRRRHCHNCRKRI